LPVVQHVDEPVAVVLERGQHARPKPASSNLSRWGRAAWKFVSDYYDFAVTLPQTWHEEDATSDWTGLYVTGPGSQKFTNFADFADDRTLMVAAAPVATGTQLADWKTTLIDGRPKECTNTPSTETTIGGEPALIWTANCSDGFDAVMLAALHGDRGYVVYLPSATANDDAEDQSIFDGIRQSFRFTG
jgi:hypothetical protein